MEAVSQKRNGLGGGGGERGAEWVQKREERRMLHQALIRCLGVWPERGDTATVSLLESWDGLGDRFGRGEGEKNQS